MTEQKMFPVWKTIKMGTCHSIRELAHSTDIAGYGIPQSWHHGREPAYFHGAPVAPCRSAMFPRDTVSLARVAPRDLGLAGGRTREDIIAAGQAHGLQECPLEAVLQLRRQYGEDQPHGEVLVMPTVTGYSFRIVHDDAECVYGEGRREISGSVRARCHVYETPNNIVWPDTSIWIFVQPRR